MTKFKRKMITINGNISDKQVVSSVIMTEDNCWLFYRCGEKWKLSEYRMQERGYR